MKNIIFPTYQMNELCETGLALVTFVRFGTRMKSKMGFKVGCRAELFVTFRTAVGLFTFWNIVRKE